MPAAVAELVGRRRNDGQQATREFKITGVTDDDAARTAMLADAACPTTVSIGGVTFERSLKGCGVDEDYTFSADGGLTVANGIWVGRATWAAPGGNEFEQPAGSFQLSFDITGQSTRVTHARAHINRYSRASTDDVTPDYKGAINVQEDDSVEGTDILVPYFSYTLTKTFSNATIAGGWVLNTARIVGSVNLATFHGFAAGELLLYRVSGQQRADGNWDVTFGFAVSFNETSLSVGDEITGIVKDGWDYLWVYYGKRDDTVTNQTHKRPVGAYVERLYRRTAYATLAI